jgi:hypothetical protein
MMNSVPHFISYLQEFSQFFLTLYLFFLCENLFLWISENGKRADEWDPPVSHCVARCRAPIGCTGQRCHRARTIKALTVLTAMPVSTARSERLSVWPRLHSSAQVSSPRRRSSSSHRRSHLSPSHVGHRSSGRCLSSCFVSTAVPGAGVHIVVPLPGALPLLSATVPPAAFCHRCVLLPPPHCASTRSRARQRRGPV